MSFAIVDAWCRFATVLVAEEMNRFLIGADRFVVGWRDCAAMSNGE